MGWAACLGESNASTPQSRVEAPRLLKRILPRLYHCCCWLLDVVVVVDVLVLVVVLVVVFVSALCVCMSTSHAHATESKANYYLLHAKPEDVDQCNPKNLPSSQPCHPKKTRHHHDDNTHAKHESHKLNTNEPQKPSVSSKPWNETEHSPDYQVL